MFQRILAPARLPCPVEAHSFGGSHVVADCAWLEGKGVLVLPESIPADIERYVRRLARAMKSCLAFSKTTL
jgi:hypothetical protein